MKLNNIELARKRAIRFYQYHRLTVPVDVETILKKYADVSEDIIPCEGDAICINYSERPQIIIKSNISLYRKRFTYAHELAHIQIPKHTGMLSCHTEDYNDIDNSEYNEMEQEADTFAAELLMPREWLVSLINEKENMKEIIDIVCEKAKVSVMAVVYNLVSAYPKGYMFEISNKIDEYSHMKNSFDNYKPILLYNNSHIDYQWLKCNCDNIEEINKETMDVRKFKFKSSDFDVHRLVIDLIGGRKEIDEVLNAITRKNNISYAFVIKALLEELPDGYIIKVTCLHSGCFTYIKSNNISIVPRGINKDEYDYWYSKNSIKYGKSNNDVVELKMWNFSIEFNYKEDTSDKRESKIILRSIIDNNYYDDSERKSVFGQVNGIIGNQKTQMSTMDENTFYNKLKQKFMGNVKIAEITEHKDFDQYLIKKTKEIYKNK